MTVWNHKSQITLWKNNKKKEKQWLKFRIFNFSTTKKCSELGRSFHGKQRWKLAAPCLKPLQSFKSHPYTFERPTPYVAKVSSSFSLFLNASCFVGHQSKHRRTDAETERVPPVTHTHTQSRDLHSLPHSSSSCPLRLPGFRLRHCNLSPCWLLIDLVCLHFPRHLCHCVASSCMSTLVFVMCSAIEQKGMFFFSNPSLLTTLSAKEEKGHCEVAKAIEVFNKRWQLTTWHISK